MYKTHTEFSKGHLFDFLTFSHNCWISLMIQSHSFTLNLSAKYASYPFASWKWSSLGFVSSATKTNHANTSIFLEILLKSLIVAWWLLTLFPEELIKLDGSCVTVRLELAMLPFLIAVYQKISEQPSGILSETLLFMILNMKRQSVHINYSQMWIYSLYCSAM